MMAEYLFLALYLDITKAVCFRLNNMLNNSKVWLKTEYTNIFNCGFDINYLKRTIGVSFNYITEHFYLLSNVIHI